MVWPNVRRSDLVTEQACETNTSTNCVLTHFSEFYGGGVRLPLSDHVYVSGTTCFVFP